MFEKEIILKEQLAARCLFQCSVPLRIFFRLAVMTISSALFRDDIVFLQEHFAVPQTCVDIRVGCAPSVVK
jgi:hypothetical protein